MKLDWLGDALDHWKGSLFEQLQNTMALSEFAVDAMASDPERWQEADWRLYAKLLRVELSQVIVHERMLALDRVGYFSEITHRGDLFLDPDTGIKTGKVKNASQYVFPAELCGLVERGPDRIIGVYQHVRAQKTRARLEQVLTAIRLHERSFSWCSYDSGTVAMLFLSGDASRVDRIFRDFETLLGNHAEGRIGRQRPLGPS